MENNFESFVEISEFLNIYFVGRKYSRTREMLAMKNYMDVETLKAWAEAFNEHLILEGRGLTDEGEAIKQESDWAAHFKNWFKFQDKNKNPKKLHVENFNQNGKQSANQQSGTIKGHQPFDIRSAV